MSTSRNNEDELDRILRELDNEQHEYQEQVATEELLQIMLDSVRVTPEDHARIQAEVARLAALNAKPTGKIRDLQRKREG